MKKINPLLFNDNIYLGENKFIDKIMRILSKIKLEGKNEKKVQSRKIQQKISKLKK